MTNDHSCYPFELCIVTIRGECTLGWPFMGIWTKSLPEHPPSRTNLLDFPLSPKISSGGGLSFFLFPFHPFHSPLLCLLSLSISILFYFRFPFLCASPFPVPVPLPFPSSSSPLQFQQIQLGSLEEMCVLFVPAMASNELPQNN